MTWRQPDGDHFNGFCTNRFRLTTPPHDVKVDDGCHICVDPSQTPTPCDLFRSGSDPALYHWRGQYYVGPPTFSLTPESNWIDTWHPFFDLHIPSGVFGIGAPQGTPAYWCPTEYNGDYLLQSYTHCSDWVSSKPALAVANAPQCTDVYYSGTPRFRVMSTLITNPGQVLFSVELQIRFKIFDPGTEYMIRCRTEPRESRFFFNMNSVYEFHEARNALSGSSWLPINNGPITITPV